MCWSLSQKRLQKASVQRALDGGAPGVWEPQEDSMSRKGLEGEMLEEPAQPDLTLPRPLGFVLTLRIMAGVRWSWSHWQRPAPELMSSACL